MYFFECRECEYDSDEARALSYAPEGLCPLCAEDSGHSVEMHFRPATEEETKRLMTTDQDMRQKAQRAYAEGFAAARQQAVDTVEAYAAACDEGGLMSTIAEDTWCAFAAREIVKKLATLTTKGEATTTFSGETRGPDDHRPS